MTLCNEKEICTEGSVFDNFEELSIIATKFLVNVQNIDNSYTKESLLHDISLNIDNYYNFIKNSLNEAA